MADACFTATIQTIIFPMIRRGWRSAFLADVDPRRLRDTPASLLDGCSIIRGVDGMKSSSPLQVLRLHQGHLVAFRKMTGRLLRQAGLAALALVAVQTADRATGVALAVDLSDIRTGAGFFPIAVWMQSPSNAARYKELGINTYLGLWKGPTEEQLATLARTGMWAITEQNEVGLKSTNRGVITGWMQQDEPDNAQPSALGGYGRCIPAADVVRRTREIIARDATRPVTLIFGPGVADTAWTGRGACTGDTKYYDIAVEDAGIISFDIYPVGSDTARVKGKLEYVAQGVVNLAKRARANQAVWTAIETTALDVRRPVKPLEVRAEVWMALIHGAKGICYFVHEFAPTFREDGIFRHPEIVKEVSDINRSLNQLAPVLNSENLNGRVTIDSPVPIATMLKRQGSDLYLFAVSMRNEPSQPRIAVEGIGDAVALVLDENRTVNIRNGELVDTFPGYGVHRYKIALQGALH
jgi:hypothetical protein